MTANDHMNMSNEKLVRGFVYASATMMIADGKVAKSEVGSFLNFCNFFGITKHFNEEWIKNTLTEAADICAKDGGDALLKEISHLLVDFSPEEKRSVFLTMFHVAFADEVIDENEIHFLDKIAAAMELSTLDILTAAVEFAASR